MRWSYLVILVMMASTAYASVCEISTTCTGTVVYRMSDTSNAHIALGNETDYGVKVCCPGGTAGQTILNISSNTNAHAELANQTDYSIPIRASAYMSCVYQQGVCDSSRECIGTISNNTNAHVGDCVTDPYLVHICCTYSEPSEPTPDIGPGGGGGGGGPTIMVETNISCKYGFNKPEYVVGDTAYFTFSCPQLEGFKYLATWRALNGTILKQELSRVSNATTLSLALNQPMDGILDFSVVNYQSYSSPFRAVQVRDLVVPYFMLGLGVLGLAWASYAAVGKAKKRVQRLKAITDEEKERD